MRSRADREELQGAKAERDKAIIDEVAARRNAADLTWKAAAMIEDNRAKEREACAERLDEILFEAGDGATVNRKRVENVRDALREESGK